MSHARDWAWRALLSALAGGGLTAAGIGGPLAGGALGAEAPSSSSSSSSSGSQQPASGAREQTAEQTTTTTTTAATSPAPAPASTAPSTTPTPAPSTGQVPSEPQPGGSSEQPRSASGSSPSGTAEHRQPSTATGHAKRGQKPHHASRNPASTGGASPPPLVPAPAPQVLQLGASSNIAPAPQLAAGQMAASPLLSGSLAAAQALGFYRVPLFLLPIYQAASAQYGVPWQILAAINEVETDYGNDLSVSSAGAVGWMQFMPETWLQYGVDALNAGYADPYNPVDAIFAAARYLHAAGASSNLPAAILAYNHSEAYVQSVLLRARLIASYPSSVIATLTGLTEGSLPVVGAELLSASQAVERSAGAVPAQAEGAGAGAAGVAPTPSVANSSLPGSTPAPAPAISGANAQKLADAPAPLAQLSQLSGPRGAPVLAVEDGRIVALGRSRKLGDYIVLRDTYGDVFTYASLGSIAPTYRLPKPAPLQVPKGALRAAGQRGPDPTPTQSATAGRQQPVTLHVASKQTPQPTSAEGGSVPPLQSSGGKVRVFAHPGNPDALAAARAQAARSKAVPAGSAALRRGSLVEQGTVLGRLAVDGESPRSVLRFAIRPPGSQAAIDPGPVLQNWGQLDAALHPQGAKPADVLAGATASDAFSLSAAELERAVLADPEIRLGACDRQQVASGRVDERMLALLVFLSRSGLKPTVGQLRCGHAAYANGRPLVAFLPGDTLTISAINGVPVAGHQGPGTVTDVTIRTLLTVKRPFAPKRIVSLMQYPGVPRTVAKADHAALIEIQLAPRPRVAVRARTASHSAPSAAGPTSPPLLGSAQWDRLIARIGGLAEPKLARKPSSAAIRDPQSLPPQRG